jgi:hypothetical protein
VVNGNTHGQIGENGGISSQNSNISENGEGGYSGYDGAGGGGFSENGTASQTVGLGGVSFVNGGAGGVYAEGCSYPCGAHMGYGGFGGGGGVGHAGGGGGGGYSGGGSDRNTQWSGGGGSYNSGTDQDNSSGVRLGHGMAIITAPTQSNNIPVTVCALATGILFDWVGAVIIAIPCPNLTPDELS